MKISVDKASLGYVSLALVACLWASASHASHLNEKEVAALEKQCDEQRQAKLRPKRLALTEKCMAEEGLSQSKCSKRYENYGEISQQGVRRLGKYYDLPICQEAYSARKHYKLNPGR